MKTNSKTNPFGTKLIFRAFSRPHSAPHQLTRALLVSSILTALVALGFSSQTTFAADSTTSINSNTKAVVELFTSQGCSSCPPADKLLKYYIDRKDVIALSFPVDYWDYLGWPDTFASPMNTLRQREYAHKRGDGAVYTPQVVINGVAHYVGFNKRKIDASIGKNHNNPKGSLPVPLRLSLQNDEFIIETGSASNSKNLSKNEVMFWIVAVQSSGTVNIKRGENSGHKMTYYNIVRGLTPVGSWNGKPKTIRVSKKSVAKPHADKYLVLLQKGSTGQIIGASWLTN